MRTPSDGTNYLKLIVSFLLGILLAIILCLVYKCLCPTQYSTTILRTNSSSVNKFMVYESSDFRNKILNAVDELGLLDNSVEETECTVLSNIESLVGLYIKPDTMRYVENYVGLDNDMAPITVQDPVLKFNANLVILDEEGNENPYGKKISFDNSGLSIAELSTGEEIVVILERSGNNGIQRSHLQFAHNLPKLERAFIGIHDLVQIFCNSEYIGISGSKISVGRHEVIDPDGNIQELPNEPTDYFTLKFTGFNSASLNGNQFSKAQLSYLSKQKFDTRDLIGLTYTSRGLPRKKMTPKNRNNSNSPEESTNRNNEIPGETFATPCPRRWYTTN